MKTAPHIRNSCVKLRGLTVALPQSRKATNILIFHTFAKKIYDMGNFDCVVCGGPLKQRGQRYYCSKSCYRKHGNAKYREKLKARRLVFGENPAKTPINKGKKRVQLNFLEKLLGS